MTIYLNNAATTWPKPPCVAEAMSAFLMNEGANAGRGSASARDMGTLDMILECRERVASLFGGYENASPRYVTFTANITESLNLVLKGFLKPGMSVLTTSMEHNAVTRPLRRLEETGVKLQIVPCDGAGRLEAERLAAALDESGADLAVICHGSNVCGTVQDLEECARICREKNVPLVADTAQTAGLIPLDASRLGLAALCFTGHKGLMGPQGIGGVVWRPDFAVRCLPLVEGGTGSFSHLERQPNPLPDRFESGTLNLPGIAGLNAALDWIEKRGVDDLRRRENELGARLLDGLKRMDGVHVYGLPDMTDGARLAVFAVNFDGVDNALLADEMSRCGVETRPGLHCSPWAHRTLGSFPQGSLRISIGAFNTHEEIDKALMIIDQSVEKTRSVSRIAVL